MPRPHHRGRGPGNRVMAELQKQPKRRLCPGKWPPMEGCTQLSSPKAAWARLAAGPPGAAPHSSLPVRFTWPSFLSVPLENRGCVSRHSQPGAQTRALVPVLGVGHRVQQWHTRLCPWASPPGLGSSAARVLSPGKSSSAVGNVAVTEEREAVLAPLPSALYINMWRVRRPSAERPATLKGSQSRSRGEEWGPHCDPVLSDR